MNTDPMHMPKIVRNVFGASLDRSTLKATALDGAAIYLGGFVPLVTGSDAAPNGAEFGIPAFADDSRIFGFVVNMTRKGSPISVWNDDARAGTVTNATGELPVKYTFSATNDESNTTSGKYEEVEIMPIVPGDILEVSLWGAGAVAVARGTTTAWGTTTSSANIGIGLAVDTTYHFALLESGASKTLANQDFMTVRLDGSYPASTKRVYVMPIRAFDKFNAVDA